MMSIGVKPQGHEHLFDEYHARRLHDGANDLRELQTVANADVSLTFLFHFHPDWKPLDHGVCREPDAAGQLEPSVSARSSTEL